MSWIYCIVVITLKNGTKYNLIKVNKLNNIL